MSKLELTKEEVAHVAKLANLNLSEEEIEKFQKQLSQILDYVRNLQQVDTSNIKPTSQVTGLENVLREDKQEKGLSQKEALSGAKGKEDGLFKAKSIFGES